MLPVCEVISGTGQVAQVLKLRWLAVLWLICAIQAQQHAADEKVCLALVHRTGERVQTEMVCSLAGKPWPTTRVGHRAGGAVAKSFINCSAKGSVSADQTVTTWRLALAEGCKIGLLEAADCNT